MASKGTIDKPSDYDQESGVKMRGLIRQAAHYYLQKVNNENN